MPRITGATDNEQRKRWKKTETEKLNLKEKKQKYMQQKQNAAKSSFFTPPPSRDNPLPCIKNEEEQDDIADTTDRVVYDELHVPIFRGVVRDEEIIAELDEEGDDEDDNKDDDEDADFEIEKQGSDTDDKSVMKTYLSSIQDRLREEMGSKTLNTNDKWLLELLRDDEWKRSSKVCRKLGLTYGEKSYYRSVRVWFPELQYGQECMPSCVSCFSNCKVGVHAYSKKTPARRVVALTTNYFVMSRQYICHTCSKLNKERKTQAVGGPYEKVQYTFMGYNSDVLTRLPDGTGDEFPAVLTYRSGLDKMLFNLMRPCFDKGLRPHALSDTLVELHSKNYTDDYIKSERLLSKKLALNVDLSSVVMFSRFSDKSQYDGLIPTGKYLSSVYNKHGKSLRQHYGREVKKRGCEHFHIDASYKAPKHLFQYHGNDIFHALITATNQFREVRLQQLSVTDGHDQLTPAIRAMLDTMVQYGQSPPKLAITDNALRDRSMLTDEMESLRDTQIALDEFTKNATADEAGMESNVGTESNDSGIESNVGTESNDVGTKSNATIYCKISDRSCYKVVSKVADINVLAEAI